MVTINKQCRYTCKSSPFLRVHRFTTVRVATDVASLFDVPSGTVYRPFVVYRSSLVYHPVLSVPSICGAPFILVYHTVPSVPSICGVPFIFGVSYSPLLYRAALSPRHDTELCVSPNPVYRKAHCTVQPRVYHPLLCTFQVQ